MEENWLLHPIFVFEVTALAGPTQQQQITIADHHQRLVAIEEHLKPRFADHTFRNNSLVAVISAAVLGLGWWVFFITSSVIAMRQQLADGGNKQIVAELNAPKSEQQLQANLSTVIAQVQRAQLDGQKPNPEKISALGGALSRVVQRSPGVPDAWHAAATLINYRTAAKKSNNQICKPSGNEMAIGLSPDFKVQTVIILQDCTLVLDDAPEIVDTKSFKAVPENERGLILKNVHVIYRGGAIIPVKGILFAQCSFDFQMYSAPPLPARSLTVTLLASNNLDRISFQEPTV
jgi:hypothetical protein